MNSLHFLAIVALAQGVLLASVIVLIVLNRWFRVRRRVRLQPRSLALTAAMADWTAGTGSLDAVLGRLAALPVTLAVDALVEWSSRVPRDRWPALTTALEQQWWARFVRANVSSARWWKRLEAARFLSVAGAPADTERILTLLRDEHPAVHMAAVGTLERVDSTALAGAALERLPKLGPTVGAYYAGMLKRSRPLIVERLVEMLGRREDAGLPRVAEFAARVPDPALREPLTALATHRDAEVRTQAARALASYKHPASLAALLALAEDPQWPVRAQAIRSLGVLADVESLPVVRAALRDPDRWVRLRAGLALTRLGSGGRNALLEAELAADPQARRMAGLILGLSPEALAEFAA